MSYVSSYINYAIDSMFREYFFTDSHYYTVEYTTNKVMLKDSSGAVRNIYFLEPGTSYVDSVKIYYADGTETNSMKVTRNAQHNIVKIEPTQYSLLSTYIMDSIQYDSQQDVVFYKINYTGFGSLSMKTTQIFDITKPNRTNSNYLNLEFYASALSVDPKNLFVIDLSVIGIKLGNNSKHAISSLIVNGYQAINYDYLISTDTRMVVNLVYPGFPASPSKIDNTYYP